MEDLLLRYTYLPNLHPALVHLPLGLAPVALLVDLIASLLRRRVWLDRAGTGLWILAAAAAAVALEAGEEAADSLADVAPAAQAAIGNHSDWAHYALWALGALALLRLGLTWLEWPRAELGRWPVRALLLAAAVAALALLLYTADLGGGLVFRHGLGVSPAEALEIGAADPTTAPEPTSPEPAAEGEGSATPESRLVAGEDGSLTWEPLPGDADALGTVLRPASGSSVEAVTAQGTGGLALRVQGRSLLMLPGSFGNLQVEAVLDLEGFNGTLGLAHHGASAETVSLFTVSSAGQAALVDLRDGERKVLDESPCELPAESFTLAVSAAGRHLKGLVDGRQVVHGHISPSADGAAGLLLDGEGVVRVLAMRVSLLPE